MRVALISRIALHWIVGLTGIAVLSIGIYVHETETCSLWQINRSVGILIFTVILHRVAWRIKHGRLAPVSVYPIILATAVGS